MSKDKLLIVWSSGEAEVAKKLVLLYGNVILPRNYWDYAILMVWGPSAKLLAEDIEIQDAFAKVLATGVKANGCIVCSDTYGVSEKLSSLGVELIHTGELLTECLKGDWKAVTF